MTKSHGTAPEQQDSRPPEEREARVQKTRGMVRRMMRNQGFILVEVERAETPHEAIVAWADGLAVKPVPADLSELADRMRDALAFEEDGALAGERIVDALAKQAGLIRAWPQRARLNTLAGQLHGLLCELGML